MVYSTISRSAAMAVGLRMLAYFISMRRSANDFGRCFEARGWLRWSADDDLCVTAMPAPPSAPMGDYFRIAAGAFGVVEVMMGISKLRSRLLQRSAVVMPTAHSASAVQRAVVG